jgi:hypothetical protein
MTSTATPAEIDAQIAELNTRRASALASADTAAYRAEKATQHPQLRDEWLARASNLLDEASALLAQTTPLVAEYTRRQGWTRYYLVDGGHVHTSTACHTCYPTTRYYWLTSESGKTAAEVVEQAGERACTVCFPAAPVATRTRPSNYRTPDEAARDEAAAAKAAKAASQITTPDGQPLHEVRNSYSRCASCRDGDQIKTAVAAWRRALQDSTDLATYGSDHPEAPAWRATVDRCVEALAAHRGVTTDSLRQEIAKKVAAKAKREGWTVTS